MMASGRIRHTLPADPGIAANAAAAYHRKHLFVPRERAVEAIAILRSLSRS